jgi:hypothetical protein
MIPLLRASFAFTVSFSLVVALAHCSSNDGSGGAAAGDDASTTTDGPGGGGDDASGGGDSGGDAKPLPPRCDPNKPFGAATMVLENSFVIDQSARLSADELTLYYAGYGQPGFNGTAHLWVATRTSTSVPFKNPKRIDELATDDGELYPTVTADGLTIYYEGSLGDAQYGVIKATRASTSAPWTNLTLLTGLQLSMVYVTHDGKRLYGMYGDQIYAVDLPYAGGAPQPIYSGTPRVYWPVVSNDGLSLFMSWPTYPYQWELQLATRPTTADKFGADKGVPEINTTADEHPTWISPDGCALYFQRVNAQIPGNASGLLMTMRGL